MSHVNLSKSLEMQSGFWVIDSAILAFQFSMFLDRATTCRVFFRGSSEFHFARSFDDLLLNLQPLNLASSNDCRSKVIHQLNEKLLIARDRYRKKYMCIYLGSLSLGLKKLEERIDSKGFAS